jgi:hypothetical protein
MVEHKLVQGPFCEQPDPPESQTAQNKDVNSRLRKGPKTPETLRGPTLASQPRNDASRKTHREGGENQGYSLEKPLRT